MALFPEFAQLRRHQKELAEAVNLFRSIPEHHQVYVDVADKLREARATLKPEAQQLRTEARLAYVLYIFEICAEEHLKLVKDDRTQDAYFVMLREWRRNAWRDYTGYEIELRRS